MALKLTPITSQSPKFPSFALPPMASFRSPKFLMASTLRSGSKCVLLLLLLLSTLFCHHFVPINFPSLYLFHCSSAVWIWDFFLACPIIFFFNPFLCLFFDPLVSAGLMRLLISVFCIFLLSLNLNL